MALTGFIKLGTIEFNVGKWSMSVRKHIKGEDITDDIHNKHDIGLRTRSFLLLRVDIDNITDFRAMIVQLESKEKTDLRITLRSGIYFEFDGIDGKHIMEVQIESYDVSKTRGIDDHFVIDSIRLVQAGEIK